MRRIYVATIEWSNRKPDIFTGNFDQVSAWARQFNVAIGLSPDWIPTLYSCPPELVRLTLD